MNSFPPLSHPRFSSNRLGLTETIVDQSLRVFYNNPTSSGNPTKEPPSPSSGHRAFPSRVGRFSTPTFQRSNSDRTIEKVSPPMPRITTDQSEDSEDSSIRLFRQKMNVYKADIEDNASARDARSQSQPPGFKSEVSKARPIRSSFKKSVENQYHIERGSPRSSISDPSELIDVQEVLEGTPMFRQKLKAAENVSFY